MQFVWPGHLCKAQKLTFSSHIQLIIGKKMHLYVVQLQANLQDSKTNLPDKYVELSFLFTNCQQMIDVFSKSGNGKRFVSSGLQLFSSSPATQCFPPRSSWWRGTYGLTFEEPPQSRVKMSVETHITLEPPRIYSINVFKSVPGVELPGYMGIDRQN